MEKEFSKQIILEDGQVYWGHSFGAEVEKVLEIVLHVHGGLPGDSV